MQRWMNFNVRVKCHSMISWTPFLRTISAFASHFWLRNQQLLLPLPLVISRSIFFLVYCVISCKLPSLLLVKIQRRVFPLLSAWLACVALQWLDFIWRKFIESHPVHFMCLPTFMFILAFNSVLIHNLLCYSAIFQLFSNVFFFFVGMSTSEVQSRGESSNELPASSGAEVSSKVSSALPSADDAQRHHPIAPPSSGRERAASTWLSKLL